jgi:amino acid transporter
LFAVLSVKTVLGRGGVDFAAPIVGDGSAVGLAPLLGGAAVLCLSFLGFDAVSTLAEEARRPRRDIPRAIIITTVLAGAIFIAVAYLGALVVPGHNFADPDAAALKVVDSAGGQLLSNLFGAAFLAGAFGAALTNQFAVARILYSMGRVGALPRSVFGRLSARFSTPVPAILVVSAVASFALLITLDEVASMISFGALAAFSVVNASVVKHYLIDRKRRGAANLLRFGVLPALGFLLTVGLWTSLSGRTLIIGLIWLAVGVGWLAVITSGFRLRAPDVDPTAGMDDE